MRHDHNSPATHLASPDADMPASEAATIRTIPSDGSPPRKNPGRKARGSGQLPNGDQRSGAAAEQPARKGGRRKANTPLLPKLGALSGTPSESEGDLGRSGHVMVDFQRNRAASQPSGGNAGRAGREPDDAQGSFAGAQETSGDGGRIGHRHGNTQGTGADPQPSARKGGRRVHVQADTQAARASPHSPLTGAILEYHRRRQDLHRAEKSLTLQIKAICRRATAPDKPAAEVLYDAIDVAHRKAAGRRVVKAVEPHPLAEDIGKHLAPLMTSRSMIEDARKAAEKPLIAAAQDHPLWKAFAEEIDGLGAMSFGQIIAEVGEPHAYRSVAGLWKRAGVGRFQNPKNGEWLTQRKYSDAAVAEAAGYAPTRRSILFVIQENLVKLNKGYYRQVYDDRKAHEAERAEELKASPPAGLSDLAKKSYMSPGHIHRRAMRYMMKRLLRQMWRASRKLAGISDPAPAAGPRIGRQPELQCPAAPMESAA